jgi:hypothetical protein
MLAIWCSGYVASEPSQDYAGQPKFLIDCRARKGQSGSPVIAYRNGSFTDSNGGINLGSGATWLPLGVYTGRIHPEADIGVVWKWSVVDTLSSEMDLHLGRKIQSTIVDFGTDSPQFQAALRSFNLSVEKT